jgi:hypothetical protein
MARKRARKTKAEAETSAPEPTVTVSKDRISLGALLSEKPPTQAFQFWLIGDTPLICHAWSEKAKYEMLSKQAGATRSAKEKRNPEQDFVDSLYEMGDDTYGFPVTAIKKSILSSAHKDRGVPRSDVMTALWLDAEVVRVRPALAGAVCDMPLVRIYGPKPEMREDMVRIGAGLRKTANLCYRGQFTVWGIRVTGNINPAIVATHQLSFLISQSGKGIGIGDWRNEKSGVFGAYHMGNVKEEEAWDKFAAGKGPLPVSEIFKRQPPAKRAA